MFDLMILFDEFFGLPLETDHPYNKVRAVLYSHKSIPKVSTVIVVIVPNEI